MIYFRVIAGYFGNRHHQILNISICTELFDIFEDSFLINIKIRFTAVIDIKRHLLNTHQEVLEFSNAYLYDEYSVLLCWFMLTFIIRISLLENSKITTVFQ